MKTPDQPANLTGVKTIRAVYEGGVFRPLDPVDLPEGCRVEFEPRLTNLATMSEAGLDKIYEIMGREFASGEHDVAARHNEHQP